MPHTGSNSDGRRRGSMDEWFRRFIVAWTSIYERIAYTQLPLTDLLAVAERRTVSKEAAEAIRTVRVPGSHRSYGILAPERARLTFRVKTGTRPAFEVGLKFVNLSQQLCERGPDCRVTVGFVGVQSPVLVQSVVRRVRLDLKQYCNREIVLTMETEASAVAAGVSVVWDRPRLLDRRSFKAQLRALVADVRKLGYRGMKHALWDTLKGELAIEDQKTLYRLWVEKQRLDAQAVEEIARSIADFRYLPRFSILTPVYNTNPEWLGKCIESVQAQLYPHWQLCLVDDASTKSSVAPLLRDYAARDSRIKVAFSDRNRGISVASNMALQLAEGEFIGLLDHDDELEPDSLFEIAKLLQDRTTIDVIYTDEDKLDLDGGRSEPFFKPDWSPEYLRSCMYTSHFTVYRKQVVDDVGGFRPGLEGSQDYDLMLRAVERTNRVYHIPKVLYHWRRTAGSAADSTSAKPYAYRAARKALTDHIKRQELKASLVDGRWRGHYRLRHVVDSTLRVTILVLAGSEVESVGRCVDSIRAKTRHSNHETVIVTGDAHIGSRFENSVTRVVRVAPPVGSTHSSLAINDAVREIDSPHVVFLDGGTEVIGADWLEAMLEFSQQRAIGVVGAKLLSSDGRINHAGVVTGIGTDEIAGHPMRGFPRDTNYHFGWVGDVRNCSAVSGACMMVRRDIFQSLGGYDEGVGPPVNSLDYCLRVIRMGRRVVWTPFAELYQHMVPFESFDASDVALMRSRWGRRLLNDPYYNVNLTRNREDFGIRL
jgi:glycosyltransferase involved in cell wall biosynthesis